VAKGMVVGVVVAIEEAKDYLLRIDFKNFIAGA
jgi:hypothetical protein